MESERYWQNIRSKLGQFITEVCMDGSVNLQSLNNHAEGFFVEFLNLLYDWNLKNANAKERNATGIDLIDQEKHVLVQVSSDHTHGKIQDSMDGAAKKGYQDYHYYFMAISETTQNFRAFQVPDGLTFNEKRDVLNNQNLMRDVMDAGIDKQKALSELVDKYFGATEKKLSCLTRMPPNANTDNVICREKELAEITALIKEGKDILLMSGFGGIGKTALARLVIHSVKDRFDEVAWVPYNGNLKNSMLASIELEEDLRDPEERWQMIRALKNDGKKKLFVIDNADHNDNQDPQKDDNLKALSGWPNTTVIVTSRLSQLGSYQPYSVGFLPKEEDCIELFYLYYENDPERTQLETVRKLLKLARNHTFTIELLAKSANCEDDLAQYHQELVEKGFSFPEIEVDTAHNEATATIAEHLKILFDMRTRTPVQTELLWDFAVLPVDASLNKTEIKDWFGINVNQCERLVSDGWLSRKEGRYAMHPLVREIIRLNEVPAGTAEYFLDFVADEGKNYFSEDVVYTELNRRLELADAVLDAADNGLDALQLSYIFHNMGTVCRHLARYDDALKYHNKDLAICKSKLGEMQLDIGAIYNNLGLVFYDIADFPKAIEYQEKALRISQNNKTKSHLETAIALDNLALSYHSLGDFQKALDYHNKSLLIKTEKLGRDHLSTAITYNNLAGIYRDIGDISKALEYLEQAQTIYETKLGTECLQKARIYSGLAGVYQDMGDKPKALKYNKKALTIKEKVLGPNHPSTAQSYNNLANVYHAMGDLPKAREYLEKALAICENMLGKDHPSTATTYNNLGALYYEMEQYPDAIDYLLRALRIRLAKLVPEHPYTKGTYEWLSDTYQAQHGETDSFLPWLRGELNAEEKRALDELLGA